MDGGSVVLADLPLPCLDGSVLMNADCYYACGSSHNVCQDYAVVDAPEETARAFVADGCGSSEDTDIGARLLCRLAQRYWSLNDINSSAMNIVCTARVTLDLLAVPDEALDSTLLVANADKEFCTVRMFGDGVVVVRDREGLFKVFKVEYNGNAPLYLSYFISEGRRAKYVEQGLGVMTVKEIRDGEVVNESEIHFKNEETAKDNSWWAMIEARYHDLVLLFSDGVDSFTSVEQTETGRQKSSVSLTDVLDEFMKIKGTGGEFIKRRAKRFLRDAAKRGWQHEDDFSVAGIWLDKPPVDEE